MHWPFFLALKYLFPSGKRFTFFTVISIFGIALGVMVLVVVQSVMNGFDYTIQTKLVQINGQVKVLSPEIIENADKLLEEIRAIPGVIAITPFAQGIVLVQHDQYVQFPKILGIDLNTVEEVLPLSTFVKNGNLTSLKTTEGVFLSQPLAQSLRISFGKYLDVYSPLMLEALKRDEILLPKELALLGTFETGWADVDRDTLFCSLKTLQALYGLGKGVHGFSLKIDEQKVPLATFCKQLNRLLPKPLRAYSWLELSEDLLYVLRLEKTMMFFVVLFVVLVAAFSISSGLMTLVIRKSREIGLLRVWGASRKHIVQLFCWQAMLLGASGVGVGFGGGLLALHFRDPMMAFLSKWFLPKDLLWKFYSFAHLPVHYEASDFIAIAFATLFIALCAAILPAWRATHLNLSENLRGE